MRSRVGLIASVLITAARKIKFKGWNPDPDTERALNRIMAFSEDKPEPVVVILDNLDMDHIKDEGGEHLKEGFISRKSLINKVLPGLGIVSDFTYISAPNIKHKQPLIWRRYN